jgi:hypothetical protein
MGKKIVGVAKSTMKYELPFTPKKLERAYKMRPSEDAASVSLSIVKIRYDGNKVVYHYQIEKYDDFATRPFDELYELMSIPRDKLDRSANDQIERLHIR